MDYASFIVRKVPMEQLNKRKDDKISCKIAKIKVPIFQRYPRLKCGYSREQNECRDRGSAHSHPEVQNSRSLEETAPTIQASRHHGQHL